MRRHAASVSETCPPHIFRNTSCGQCNRQARLAETTLRAQEMQCQCVSVVIHQIAYSCKYVRANHRNVRLRWTRATSSPPRHDVKKTCDVALGQDSADRAMSVSHSGHALSDAHDSRAANQQKVAPEPSSNMLFVACCASTTCTRCKEVNAPLQAAYSRVVLDT